MLGLRQVCAWCNRVRDDTGVWISCEALNGRYTVGIFSHGICPDCRRRLDLDTGKRRWERG